MNGNMKDYLKILDCYIATLEDDLRVAKKNNQQSRIVLLSTELETQKNYRKKVVEKFVDSK